MTPAEPSPAAVPAGTPAGFAQRTPWTAGAATVFALITIVTALLVARMAQPLHARLGNWLGGTRALPGPDDGLIANTMLTMLVLYAVIIACVWWGAGRFGGDRPHLLSVAPGLPGVGPFVVGLGVMTALLVPWNLATWLLWPEQFGADLRPFWELARSRVVWLAAIVIVVGAPLAEELLFRGFLLPALTKTRYGFRGAAVISTAGWTALHTYSVIGTLEVFLIGLFFSWLMWRFANLWLPIILHGLYNGLQLAVMALWPAG